MFSESRNLTTMVVTYCGGNLTPYGRGGGKFEPGASKSFYSSATLWLIKKDLQKFFAVC